MVDIMERIEARTSLMVLFDGLADEIHPGDLVGAIADLLDFPVMEDDLEEVAGVDDADDDDIARIGYLVAEQDARDAALDLALLPIVDDRIAPRLEHPENLLLHALQDPSIHEAIDEVAHDLRHVLRGSSSTSIRRTFRFRGRDPGEEPVQHLVAHRRRIDHEEPLRIGIDPVGEREIHEDAPLIASSDVYVGPADEGALLVVEKEEQGPSSAIVSMSERPVGRGLPEAPPGNGDPRRASYRMAASASSRPGCTSMNLYEAAHFRTRSGPISASSRGRTCRSTC